MRKCAHPVHGNRKGKPERVATLEMSKEIMSKWNTLVPVGAGICKLCRNDHLAAVRVVNPGEDSLTLQSEEPAVTQSEEFTRAPEPIYEFLPLQLHASSDSGSQLERETYPCKGLPLHKGEALRSDDGSDVFSSGSQESSTAIET